MTELGRVTLLVRDCDEAFEFYEKNLGCKKFFDLLDKNGKRYLHLGFNSEQSAGIWLTEPETDEQSKRIGDQTGGLPVFVVYTDTFDEFVETVKGNGTEIIRGPEIATGHRVFEFHDLYGNPIVAVESVPHSG